MAKLDFASHHIELLQAIALTRPRRGSAKPLGSNAEELKKSLKDLGDYLQLAELDLPADLPETEIRKRMVLAEMRGQTFAVRNWAYPEHALNGLKALFAGPLSGLISSIYEGVSIVRVIDMLKTVTHQIEDRLNEHTARLREFGTAEDFDSVHSRYEEAFPDVIDDHEGMRKAFVEFFHGDLTQLKLSLMEHADLRLQHIYTFTVNDAVRAYGDEACRDGLLGLLRAWSYNFGDLSGQDPKRFLYTNPRAFPFDRWQGTGIRVELLRLSRSVQLVVAVVH